MWAMTMSPTAGALINRAGVTCDLGQGLTKVFVFSFWASGRVVLERVLEIKVIPTFKQILNTCFVGTCGKRQVDGMLSRYLRTAQQVQGRTLRLRH